jgi:hypothetical protein
VTPGARHSRAAAFLLLALLAGANTACITRTIRQTVVDDGLSQVILRSEKRGGQAIDKGFEHPASIAPVRIAHILSRIDLRHEDGKQSERIPAVPLDTLFAIADGIATGLKAADSSQELVVQSVRRGKHWGIFERQFLTSLLCYMKNDIFYVQISRSDWEIPVRRESRLPETHVGKYPLEFRLVVEKGMTLVDYQTVAVDWRDPIFKKPTRTRMTSTGKVVRRTVLMESLEDETDYGPRPQISDDLSPEQLRALADLEEERRRGDVTEAEYDARRNRILRGEAVTP